MGAGKALAPLIFMALFWNGIVLVFDVVIVSQAVQTSVAATSFVPVDARVTASSVSRIRSDDGTQYRPEIQYEYDYEGIHYLGDRRTFLEFATSDRSYSKEICAEYPVGAAVTAYVDPDEPSEAVLDVSGDSFPAAMLLFLLPFNCAGLMLIALVVSSFRQRLQEGRGAGAQEDEELRARYVQVDTGDHVVFAKKSASAIVVFTSAVAGLSFLSMFGVVGFTGFTAPIGTVAAVILGCFGGAALLTWWLAKRARAPKNFLHVDRLRGTFSYPADRPGEPLESIQSILAEAEPSGMVVNGTPYYKHVFDVETKSGPKRLFEVNASMSEGEEVLNLLRSELLRS